MHDVIANTADPTVQNAEATLMDPPMLAASSIEVATTHIAKDAR